MAGEQLDPFEMRRRLDTFAPFIYSLHNEWRAEGTPVWDAVSPLADPETTRTAALSAVAWAKAGRALADHGLGHVSTERLEAVRREGTPEYGHTDEQVARHSLWTLLVAAVAGDRPAVDDKLSEVARWLDENLRNLPLFLDAVTRNALGLAGLWESVRSRRFVDRLRAETARLGVSMDLLRRWAGRQPWAAGVARVSTYWLSDDWNFANASPLSLPGLYGVAPSPPLVEPAPPEPGEHGRSDEPSDHAAPPTVSEQTRGPSGPFFPLHGWGEIFAALNSVDPARPWKKDDAGAKAKLKQLNQRFRGPIKLPEGRGKRPQVGREELLCWWETCRERFNDSALDDATRAGAVQATAEGSHSFGRTGTVVPEIGGSVKASKRRK